jgi:hypothetical protein
MNLATRDLLCVSIAEAVTVVEKMILATVDQEVRNILVVRLAVLDQRLAAVRDKWNLGELPPDC